MPWLQAQAPSISHRVTPTAPPSGALCGTSCTSPPQNRSGCVLAVHPAYAYGSEASIIQDAPPEVDGSCAQLPASARQWSKHSLNQVVYCTAGGLPGAKADPVGHGLGAPAILLAASSHRDLHLQGWPGWCFLPQRMTQLVLLLNVHHSTDSSLKRGRLLVFCSCSCQTGRAWTAWLHQHVGFDVCS